MIIHVVSTQLLSEAQSCSPNSIIEAMKLASRSYGILPLTDNKRMNKYCKYDLTF